MTDWTRREVLEAGAWGLAGLAGCTWLRALGRAFAEEAAGRKLNFVFFLVDDLGWRDVACYGSKYYLTPNIDKLAAQAMRFTQAYAACPVCSPTRASAMTGKYPARLHVTDWIHGHKQANPKLRIPDWIHHLPLEEVTVAEALREAGYASASIGKWHLGEAQYWPDKQGFDVNVAGTGAGQPPTYFAPYRIATLPDGPAGEYLTDRLAEEAVKFMRQNKDRPFFVYLPHYAVHTPLQAKKDLIAQCASRPPDGGQKNPTYAAMIQSVDECVARVLKELDELGLADKTIVFFMSDNGGFLPSTSNAPLRDGKGTLYEGGIREPLIIKWPGVTKVGSICETPVISNDFYPTILEMAGLKLRPAQHRDGVSLAPLLRGTGQLDRQTLYWHYPHYHRTTPAGALRHGDLKLIEYFEDSHVELYDLKTDLSETNDLAAAMPEKAAELRKMLADWRNEIGAQMPTPNPDYREGGAGASKKGARKKGR